MKKKNEKYLKRKKEKKTKKNVSTSALSQSVLN